MRGRRGPRACGPCCGLGGAGVFEESSTTMPCFLAATLPPADRARHPCFGAPAGLNIPERKSNSVRELNAAKPQAQARETTLRCPVTSMVLFAVLASRATQHASGWRLRGCGGVGEPLRPCALGASWRAWRAVPSSLRSHGHGEHPRCACWAAGATSTASVRWHVQGLSSAPAGRGRSSWSLAGAGGAQGLTRGLQTKYDHCWCNSGAAGETQH